MPTRTLVGIMLWRRGWAVLTASLATLLLVLPGSSLGAQETSDYLSWANPGPYRAPDFAHFTIDSFRSDQPIVGTYFFYWFDGVSEQRRAPFNTTPVDFATESYLDPAWYDKQFRDMQAAGIDFVLPDYWGELGQYPRRSASGLNGTYFSTDGIPAMVQTLERFEHEGHPLKIALFLDTTILNNEDLTTDRGKQIFYASIRDWFSRIPPHLWAAIDGRPIVWIYDAQQVYRFNQSTFDYVYQQFPQDFGGLNPWIVREWQWLSDKNTGTDNLIRTEGFYGWGAAPSGFNPDTRFTVAAVGPGFEDNDPNPVRTPRGNGDYYRLNLERAIASGRNILAIETWNEVDEGTGILETVEYGRQYIDLTRQFVDQFKARTRANQEVR